MYTVQLVRVSLQHMSTIVQAPYYCTTNYSIVIYDLLLGLLQAGSAHYPFFLVLHRATS